MNSMELVRFPGRSLRPSPSGPAKQSPAPFRTELIGPVRNAIVRARQLLVSRQQDDGTWLGRQAADVTLATQLIFLLSYLVRGDAELIQQCAASILHEQLPDGGWSVLPDAPSDVSASVQAYFALKLAGLDASGETLSRARRRIRQLGGADAADSETRFYLALLGQIDYDCCDVRPPEWIFTRGREGEFRAPLMLVWSHRPIRQIGIERGVRELFLTQPQDWPATAGGSQFRSFYRRLLQMFEHSGWNPLRRSALAKCESQLTQQVAPARISELDFSQLIWHTVTLHTIGFGDDGAELRRCEEWVRKMVSIDDDDDLAQPRLRDTRWTDTSLALQSLLVSGTSLDNPAIAAAIDAVLKNDETKFPRQTIELCDLMYSLWRAESAETDCDHLLPPDLGIWWDSRSATKRTAHDRERRPERVQTAINQALDQLLASQNRDGGWGPNLCPTRLKAKSDCIVTAKVIETIYNLDRDDAKPLFERGLTYLRAAQHADGSWADSDGCQKIMGTSQAIRALLAAGAAPDDDAVAAGVNWLLVEQQANGGWYEPSFDAEANENGPSARRKTSASQSACAILALVAAGRADAQATRRGIDYLLNSQDHDGGWTDHERLLYDPLSKRFFCNELHAIAWPLWALSAWAVAAESAKSEAADQMSLRLVDAFAEI
jgi:squalene-hopene/tetraprenyl-beta-curcumene cyclase